MSGYFTFVVCHPPPWSARRKLWETRSGQLQENFDLDLEMGCFSEDVLRDAKQIHNALFPVAVIHDFDRFAKVRQCI